MTVTVDKIVCPACGLEIPIVEVEIEGQQVRSFGSVAPHTKDMLCLAPDWEGVACEELSSSAVGNVYRSVFGNKK